MNTEKKFEELFDDYNTTQRVENSIKNYSNWLLGISLGLAAVSISLITKDEEFVGYFILPLISIFLGILFNGYIKREILLREIKMNAYFGQLKKIKILHKIKELSNSNTIDESDKQEWDNIFKKFWSESDKLSNIGHYLNWSSRITYFNVLLTGVVIIYILLKTTNQ